MSRVECATESWGVITDQAGNVRTLLPVTITSRVDGSAAILYDAITGGNPIVSPVTDGNGAVPGFIEQGSYTITVDGGDDGVVSHAIEAGSGAGGTGTVTQSSTASQAGTSVCVGAVSQIILPANPNRLKMILSLLDTVNPVDIAFGDGGAVVGAGIRLWPYSPPFVDQTFTGIVYAIATASNTCIGITEV